MNNYKHLNLNWIPMDDLEGGLKSIRPGMFIKNVDGDILLIGDRVIGNDPERYCDIAGPGCGCCADTESDVVAVAFSGAYSGPWMVK